jgi:hypothetical protein
MVNWPSKSTLDGVQRSPILLLKEKVVDETGLGL